MNSPSIAGCICIFIFRWHQDISTFDGILLLLHSNSSSSSSSSSSSISGNLCIDKVLWQEEEVPISNDCDNISYTFF